MSPRGMSVCAAVLLFDRFYQLFTSARPAKTRCGARRSAARTAVTPEQLTRDTDDFFKDMDFNIVDGQPHRAFTKERDPGPEHVDGVDRRQRYACGTG